MRALCLALFVLLPSLVTAQPWSDVAAPWSSPQHREFDFWTGEWDVNLRIRQEDGSWLDAKRATAHIFRVLDGKAILELWDEQADGEAIRGFSLRYFDPELGMWRLHLDWPGPNRSAVSSLRGTFRHGRGEFFSERDNPDGTKLLTRYTFSDIGPDRLRWDDAYSQDGGKSWSHNWIMEFERTAAATSWPAAGAKAHTYRDGSRCDLPQFREFEALAGEWSGSVSLQGGEPVPAALTAYRILDGCGVVSFFEYTTDMGFHHELGFHTYNTYIEKLEHARLLAAPGGVLTGYFGERVDDALVLEGHGARVRWRVEGDELELTVEDSNAPDGTAPTLSGTLARKP